MVIDNVVCNWLSMMINKAFITHGGMVLAVVWFVVMFYADDGLVVLQESEWLQRALNMLICLFRRYGLVANVTKSKAMMCHPGEIQSGMSDEVVGRRSMGREAAYKERLKRWIP